MSTEERTDRPDDDTIARAWRRTSRDEPPAVVDEAILAAARNEADVARAGAPVAVHRRLPTPRATARTPWWGRWQPLLAAASVAGIAFVLVERLPPEPERATAPVVERDGGIAREEARIVAPQLDAAGESGAPVASPAESARSPAESAVGSTAPSADQAAPDTSRATPFASPAAPHAAGDSAMPEAAARKSSAVPAPPAARVMESATPEPAVTAAVPAGVTPSAAPTAGADRAATSDTREFARQSPPVAQPPDAPIAASDWAQRVESLHRAGSMAEAAAELRRFRAAYPDADRWLAPELRSWAATITD